MTMREGRLLMRLMWLLPAALLVLGLRSVAAGQQADLHGIVRPASAETVTALGLSLAVDDAARVTALAVSGRDVMGKADPSPFVELADVTFPKRALAYGIFPGFFDWPPSGLGPGGRYWDHPEYYERDRGIFGK